MPTLIPQKPQTPVPTKHHRRTKSLDFEEPIESFYLAARMYAKNIPDHPIFRSNKLDNCNVYVYTWYPNIKRLIPYSVVYDEKNVWDIKVIRSSDGLGYKGVRV